jgi:hypothetical protein
MRLKAHAVTQEKAFTADVGFNRKLGTGHAFFAAVVQALA